MCLRFLGSGVSEEVQNGVVRGKTGWDLLGILAGEEHGDDGVEEWEKKRRLKRGKEGDLDLERKKHRLTVVFRAIGIWQKI